MREIKFRVWDILKKKMLPVEALHFGYCETIGIKSEEVGVMVGEPYQREQFPHNPVWETARDFKGKPHSNSTVVLMQYTGLKDKNGKEIYEGDIVKDDIGIRLVKIGFSYFNDPDGIEHNFYGVYGIWEDKTESYFNKGDDDLEVIGNIYEKE